MQRISTHKKALAAVSLAAVSLAAVSLAAVSLAAVSLAAVSLACLAGGQRGKPAANLRVHKLYETSVLFSDIA